MLFKLFQYLIPEFRDGKRSPAAGEIAAVADIEVRRLLPEELHLQVTQLLTPPKSP